MNRSEESDSVYARRRAQLIWERGLPAFVREVADALAVPAAEVHGLERAAVVAAQELFSAEFGRRVGQRAPAFVFVAPAERRPDVLRICRRLSAHAPSGDMIVFWDGTLSPYAVYAPSDAVLRQGVPQVGPAHELLFALTDDASSGLWANYEIDHRRPRQHVYELVVWGPGWLQALADEPPSPLPSMW